MKSEKGFTLIETLVTMVILSITSVCFLSGLNTASLGMSLTDERETAKNLAESQMEYVKNQPYAAAYVMSPEISNEYAGYSANISVTAITARDGNIQKITVIVKHQDKEVTRLAGYKVN